MTNTPKMQVTDSPRPPPEARDDGFGHSVDPAEAVAVPRGKWRFAQMRRSFLRALTAPASPPCPHRRDGTMCTECAWHWAIR